jgi:hypothetical protein
MPCPDHVVIEVQSFCRKLGRADPKKEAVRTVEPCISTFLFRQARQGASRILISRGARSKCRPQTLGKDKIESVSIFISDDLRLHD